MRMNDLTALAADTLCDPRSAAARIIGLRLDMPTIWAALALGAVLNAMLFGINLILFPMTFPMPGIFLNPLFYAAVVAAGMAFTIFALTKVGVAMGGTGQFEDVAVLLVWLQYLRLAAQLALMVITLIFPVLGVMATLAVAFYSIWLLLVFLDTAHRFDSLGKSALVLVFALVGVILALSLVMGLMGVPAPEVG